MKPTGSTTAAIINITHAVTVMLESNKYVRCLLVDFSKAFDSVDHLALVKKLKRYNIADNIIDWIVSFLTDRDQISKLGDLRSFTHVINRSIIQGFGIGSMLFVIFISDLKPIGLDNSLTKYADDASLLVPERIDVDTSEEFSHIIKWSLDNKLTVNLAKTKEIVFHRLNPKNLVT